MVFNTPIFLAFFLAFYVFYVAIGGRHRWHLRYITLASLVFYAGWDWRYLPLLVGTGMLDFYCAVRIGREQERGATGKRWLVLTITVNLLVLGFFKYTNFLFDGVRQGGSWFGFDVDLPRLDLLLPIGISFYTFQSISYTVDVYTGSMKARRDPLVFLSALSFFPHLVAGPIVRGAQLIPQFERGPLITPARMHAGLLLVATGMFKKTVADLLAPIADAYFAGAAGDNLISAWTGVLAFSAQVYGDFAGYTDIAIGLGLILGYDFPQNFNLPYVAISPADFWRRWHMSFSTWLRDYLYLPLTEVTPANAFIPIIITMTLSGLWHGAGLTYIAWGFYLGLLIYTVERLTRWWQDSGRGFPGAAAVGRVFTFYTVVVIGMAIFRAPSLSRAASVLDELHTGAVVMPSWDGSVDAVLVILALVGCHALDWLVLRKRDTLVRPYILVPLVFILLVLSMPLGIGNEFIYFDF
ncbi:MAG TPA: MBOAT family O-acyltransferase [Kofleriaceae bacterium]